jgi:hypothetical protein
MKFLPFYYFFIVIGLLNPFMFLDAEFIIFLSLVLVVLLIIVNLNDFISKFYFNKLIEYRYNFLKNYNIQLWYIFSLIEFLNLRLFIFILPFYLKWYDFYIQQQNLIFNNTTKLLLNLIQKLNLLYSFNFLKNIKSDLFSLYVFYFIIFRGKVNVLFMNYKLANYRLMTFYLLSHLNKYLFILKNNKFDNNLVKKKFF